MLRLALVVAGLVGLAAEVWALAFLADFTFGLNDLLLYLAAHGAASALLAAVAWGLFPANYRRPVVAAYSLLFCFAFFIPLLGAGGLLAAVLVGVLMPREWRYQDFGEIERPTFAPHANDGEARLRIGAMRSLLLDPEARIEVRIRSLVAIQSMPMRVAAPLLRKLLADPSEDLRLLAYGMIDSAEKRITALIDEEQAKLSPAASAPLRLSNLRRLVELHWELVYGGLVLGDVRDHVITTALRHLQSALRIAPVDAGLWLLRGRLLQAQGRTSEAGEALNLAVSCGVDESRALPYLAELAYLERRFPLVRDYLGLLASRQLTPITAPLVSFWLGSSAA